MGAIILTPLAQHRLFVLNAVQRGEVKMADAARLLGLSVRQVRRLRAAYRRRGAAALVHGNRGRPSPRRVPDPVRTRIRTLAQTTYAGANHVHLTELLGEREALHVSRPSVRRILLEAGLRTPRTRRPPQHRVRRDRMPHPGMLVQLDGSHHAWLEDRGPRLVLHAAIDDATSTVLAGWFDAQETTRSYLQVLQQVVLGPGIPLATYTDRHSIFTRTKHTRWTLEEQLQGRPAPTQVERALHELHIQWIPASSPQAKGRIERLFGALQDRLVMELRLAGICDVDAANRFLPRFLQRYNARFARAAAQPDPLYRPWPQGVDPQTIFCVKHVRLVANDNTITVGSYQLQLLPGPGGRSYARAKVEVHERLDGSIAVWYRRQQLGLHRLAARPAQSAATPARHPRFDPNATMAAYIRTKPRARPPKRNGSLYKPAPDHPWRRYAAEDKKRKVLNEAGVTFSQNS